MLLSLEPKVREVLERADRAERDGYVRLARELRIVAVEIGKELQANDGSVAYLQQH